MKLILSSALLIASAYADPAFNQCVLDCVNEHCTVSCNPSVVDQCIQTCENGDNDDGGAGNPNADDTVPGVPNDDSDDGLDTDDTANNPNEDDNNDTSPPQDWIERCVYNCVNGDYTPFVIEECTSRCENGEPANYDDVVNPDVPPDTNTPQGWYDDEVFGSNCFPDCVNGDYTNLEVVEACNEQCFGEQENDGQPVWSDPPAYYYTFGIRESSASSNSGNNRRLRGVKKGAIFS